MQVVRKINYHFNKHRSVRIFCDIINKRRVYFNGIQRHFLYAVKRRISRSEIVQCYLHSLVCYMLQKLLHLFHIMDSKTFSDLKTYLLRGCACFVKKCVYLVKEIRLNYLTYRQIDVHSQIKPCVSPLFALSACDPYHVLTQEIDIAKSFRHRDKFGRGNLTELRWIPPHKRFTAHKLLFRATEYRLIVRREMCKAVCDILVHEPFKFDLP